jgi:hypothetical protein
MAVLGILFIGFAVMVAIIVIQVSFTHKDRVELWLGVFILVGVALITGTIITDAMYSRPTNSSTTQLVPDTLIVTGYVLEVDTLKIGE